MPHNRNQAGFFDNLGDFEAMRRRTKLILGGLAFLAVVLLVMTYKIPRLDIPRCRFYPPARAHTAVLAEGKALYQAGRYDDALTFFNAASSHIRSEPRKERNDRTLLDGYIGYERFEAERAQRAGNSKRAAYLMMMDYAKWVEDYEITTCARLLEFRSGSL